MTQQDRLSLAGERVYPIQENCVALQRLLVYPGDGRAGEDVVELVEEHLAPDLLELRDGILQVAEPGRQCLEHLGIAQG